MYDCKSSEKEQLPLQHCSCSGVGGGQLNINLPVEISHKNKNRSEALNKLTEKKQDKQKGGSNQHKEGVIRGCDVIKTVAELVVPPDSEL